jgi:hypothetical protein
MITEVCEILATGFVVLSKYWDWMACKMLHDVSVSTQRDSVLLGCDRVIGCCVAAQCIHLQGQTVSQWLLDPEVQNTVFLWSTGLYTANHTVSHPDRLISSMTPLREHHNLHHQQCFFLGWDGFSFKWNFTVLLPYTRQSLLMLLCSANQEHHTHNYTLFAVNVCVTLFVVA